MKNIILLAALLLGFVNTVLLAVTSDSSFTFGINWMLTDSTNPQFSAMHSLFDDTIACNVYHCGGVTSKNLCKN